MGLPIKEHTELNPVKNDDLAELLERVVNEAIEEKKYTPEELENLLNLES